MATTLAFDVYGSLIDTHAIAKHLQRHVGDKARAFSEIWREKQLEYSFRRALMRDYQDFSVITSEALDYACQRLSTPITTFEKQKLLAHYQQLDAFPDVAPALKALNASGHNMHAFSNGLHSHLKALLHHAQLDNLLQNIVSVDAVRSFKPDPKVYAHFNACTHSSPAETWLISSNPFDICGASACGWKTAWLKRSPDKIFDGWGNPPTTTITSLAELNQCLSANDS